MLEPRQANEATIPGAELSREAFSATYNNQVKWRMRGTWLAAAVLTLAVAVVERQWLPAALAEQLASIRIGLVVPLLVLGVVLTLPKGGRRHLQLLGGTVMLATGLALVVMGWIVQRAGLLYPYAGILIFLLFTYFLSGLRLGVATLVGCLVTVAFVVAELHAGIDGVMLQQSLLFVLVGNLACLIGAGYVGRTVWARFAAERQLEALRNRDGLTGLLSREAFHEAAPRMAAEYTRGREKAGRLMVARVDVDALRSFNDHYGYAAGDEALKAVARVLGGLFHGRRAMAARLAGEGFAIVCVVADGSEDLALFEQVRRQVEALGIAHAGSPAASVLTISVGVAPWTQDLETALAAAGRAVQSAKQNGRNQVR